MTTTVRVPVAEYEWVKTRGAEFSALLRKAIRAEMEREELSAARLVLEVRRAEEANTPIGRFKAWVVERRAIRPAADVGEIEAKKKELGL